MAPVVKMKNPARPGETKHDKAVRLAVYRVREAIWRIRLIGNLSNRSLYEFTPDEAQKMLNTLQEEVDKILARFSEKDYEPPFQF